MKMNYIFIKLYMFFKVKFFTLAVFFCQSPRKKNLHGNRPEAMSYTSQAGHRWWDLVWLVEIR